MVIDSSRIQSHSFVNGVFDMSWTYSIFPTERSAVKWARENLVTFSIEVVKEDGWKDQYSVYVAGEYWLWYRESNILS